MFHFLPKNRRQKIVKPWKQPTAITIEGRRHRIDTPYLLPQDDQEISRLDFQHYALRVAIGEDYLAPLESEDISDILDVGCGTGRWARERAEEFPLAQVTGIDIELHLPDISLPTNFQFIQSNILMGLPFADASFDFVHQRLLVGAIPALQWSSVLQEATRVTRPGGWIELLESGSVYHHAGPATKQFQTWWLEGEKTLGFHLALIPHLDQQLKKAGVKQVQMKTFQLPLGKWGGRAGEMLAKDIHAVFTSFRAVYVSRLGIPVQVFEKALAALPVEWERYHTSYECYAVYGRR